MQPTLQRLLIRRCRHGIHLANRDRNVLIADCHIYDNTGVGIFLDRVNLHQTNIHGNHISYCKQGGIKIVGSEIRNIQICSNDIEYNYDLKAETLRRRPLRLPRGDGARGHASSATPSRPCDSPGGANVRFLGAGKDHPNAVGLFAITGNLIGSQATASTCTPAAASSVTGNSIYSGYHHAICGRGLRAPRHRRQQHRPQPGVQAATRPTSVVLRSCRNVDLTGLILQHTRAGRRGGDGERRDRAAARTST